MKKRKKVFVIGDAFGSYRARAVIEFLQSSAQFEYWHTNERYFFSRTQKFWLRLLSFALRNFVRLSTLISLAICDVVYVLPMKRLSGPEFYLARMMRKKVIVDFYISLYDALVNDREQLSAESSAARKMLKLDRQTVEIAEKVIFLNQSEQAYYLKVMDIEVDVSRLVYIPLTTSRKRKANLPYVSNRVTRPTLCWWGTYIPLHGLEKIIRAAEILRSTGFSFRLYLFGNSESLGAPFAKLVSELDLSDVVEIRNDLTFADYSLEDFLVHNCDLAFGSFGDSGKAKTVLINKVIEAASMGIPVVSASTRGLSEFFSSWDNIFFSEATPEALAQEIRLIISENNKIRSVGGQAFVTYEQNFSSRRLAKELSKIL